MLALKVKRAHIVFRYRLISHYSIWYMTKLANYLSYQGKIVKWDRIALVTYCIDLSLRNEVPFIHTLKIVNNYYNYNEESWPNSSPSSTREPETDMSHPGIKLMLPRWEESTLAKSYMNSLLKLFWTSTYELVTYVLHVTLGCRPNGTFYKSFNPEYWHQGLVSRRVQCQTRQITLGSPLWRDLTKVIFIIY
jgi:hypothetical protein